MGIKLSCILPALREPYLQKTIDSLLDNSGLGDSIEIIPVLDGYWPDPPLKEDKRVKILHLGQTRGMRNAINSGVAISKGEFIMRVDSHCVFGERYGLIMTESCQPNWIMTARRYFLDPIQWKVMDIPYVDYEKLAIQSVGADKTHKKFSGIPVKRPERDNVVVDETQAMQGSMWMMPRKWWDEVIGCLDEERYQSLLQDSHEMSFKTWKAGGKLMVHKGTWFAHKMVGFPRTHNSSHLEHIRGIDNMMSDWRDYYHTLKKTWNW
jgi:hypothetical protein